MDKKVIGKQYEKELRNKATLAEKKFKNLISGIKRKYNIKFKMEFQKGWYEGEGFYISDFYFPATMATIELDGRSHQKPAQILQDTKKEIYLGKLGVRTLRLSNGTVYAHTVDSLFRYLTKHDVIK